jgi:hypothetical protein
MKGENVDLNTERRRHRRFFCEAEISHDILTQNNIYKGKLYNFSKVGLYFESDQTIYPGEEIFIKFEERQGSYSDDFMTQLPFGVEIIWQNDLSESSFRYGYGANYIDMDDSLVKNLKTPQFYSDNSQKNNLDTEKDPREFPRRSYRKTLLLSYKNKKYKGEFMNISRGGVFIKTGIRLQVGKQIRILIPGSKIRKDNNLKGWIVRINDEGFGVKFDKSANTSWGYEVGPSRVSSPCSTGGR